LISNNQSALSFSFLANLLERARSILWVSFFVTFPGGDPDRGRFPQYS
jgi:hypothetical protein